MSKPARSGTLASLAEELGVSRTTISNAYNKPDHLSAELREKILDAAQRMGYPGPDPTARSLRTRKTGAIGILLTDAITYAFEDGASLDFMLGVARACQEMGTSMLVLPAFTAEQATTLVSQAVVDGFIVYSVASDDPYLRAVEQRNIPMVICDQPKQAPECSFVGIDDFQAIAPAAQALVDHGHTKVGILCIRLDREENNGLVSPERLKKAHMDTQKQRILGALSVFEAAGIAPAEVSIVERFLNNPEMTRSAAEEILTQNPDLTAILCTTDSMALAVMDVAQDCGRSIPGDLSLTGFDGIQAALDRKLTTVIQPNQRKGQLSGEVLGRLIVEDQQPAWKRKKLQEHVLLETEFFPGETVGPAAT